MHRVARRSELATNADTAWTRAISPAGVNAELMPIVRMTMPRGVRGLDLSEFPLGETVGRSWILLFGLIPVDYDDLRLVELEPRRFLERSRTLAFSVWEHERLIEPLPGGRCVVSDRLAFELKRPLRRIPAAAALARAIVGFLFSHRHRRLRDTARHEPHA